MASSVDINAYRGVWVFVEQAEGRPARVSIELLGKGRELAGKLDVELTAFLIGESVGDLAKELIFYGADRVIVADDPILKEYGTELYTDIISEQAMKAKPEVLIVGASPIGRDLAPRLSFRLNAGCTADCTDLDIDEENRLFVSTRPAFGGNVMATIICPEHRPQMSTVRPGVMPLPERDDSRKGEIINPDLHFNKEDTKVEVLESVKGRSEGVSTQEAEKIVAIGMGAGDRETFDMIKELADLLEAKVAASRLAVEAGWISHDFQIGQTGKTVRPSLYMACGISGAVQHTAGMSGSKIIIAINSDADAEIFKIADYGIVGDVGKVVPALIAELKSLKS
ncbi:MAG: electron transfer flavoprotein subunit alpha/FixB family protein [Desulfobacteraceae bacterium]|nr:electron transfer flavoprotein subunit alpha/FixB family protein [Desulfobacteraceae bacterium]